MNIQIESSRYNRVKKSNTLKVFIISTVLLALSRLAKILAGNRPDLAEKYFSRGLYPVTSRIQTAISNLFPFSLYEVLILFLVLFAIYRIIKLIRSISTNAFSYEGIRLLKHIYLIVSVALFLFQFLWSLNNYRIPLKEQLGLTIQETSLTQLSDTYKALVSKANETRAELSGLQETVSHPFKTRVVLNTAWEGYQQLAQEYPVFHNNRVRVKGLIFSRVQTISGYSGVYSFITGEPNINTEPPLVSLPHTACHEIAHQMGISLEDEANYAGFLACKNHPNVLFQYSGYLFALTYTGNALYRHSPELYEEIFKSLSDDIRQDMEEISFFWNRYKNPSATKIADKVNDMYLKSNNQTEGIKSYGRFVDLLIADYIKNGSI